MKKISLFSVNHANYKNVSTSFIDAEKNESIYNVSLNPMIDLVNSAKCAINFAELIKSINAFRETL